MRFWCGYLSGVRCRLFAYGPADATALHPLNSPLSGTTQVSRYQKGKTNLDFTGARDSGISWAICKSAPRSRQITMPAPHHSVFTGRMPFLTPNQQCQSTEGIALQNPISSLASFKSRLVLPFWYRLTQRPLNGCGSCYDDRQQRSFILSCESGTAMLQTTRKPANNTS